jgi:hypothetical protein
MVKGINSAWKKNRKMSDKIAIETTTTETETSSEVETSTTELPQGNPVEGTDWKREARKWEDRAKAAKVDSDAAAKWREYEASLKPEQERMAEELARKSAEAEEAKATLLRYEIAAEKGISGDATRLLKGTSREELESEAELLLALIANNTKPKTPIPDENQGKATANAAGQITDRNVLKDMTPAEIMKAKTEGRLEQILARGNN